MPEMCLQNNQIISYQVTLHIYLTAIAIEQTVIMTMESQRDSTEKVWKMEMELERFVSRNYFYFIVNLPFLFIKVNFNVYIIVQNFVVSKKLILVFSKDTLFNLLNISVYIPALFDSPFRLFCFSFSRCMIVELLPTLKLPVCPRAAMSSASTSVVLN